MTLSPFRSNLRLTQVFDRAPPASVQWGVLRGGRLPLIVGLRKDGAICRLSFMEASPAPVLEQWRAEWPLAQFRRDQAAIDAVAKRSEITLSMTGTEFQQSVWKELLQVPAGQTVSYSTLAQRLNRPGASRAVGSACGANPVLLLVPCHRVLAGNGKLGGFNGGLPIKRLLLQAEGISGFAEAAALPRPPVHQQAAA